MKSFYSIALISFATGDVFQSCQKSGQIALTYDGGPSPYTGTLLNILSDKEIKASFHFTGEYLNVPYIAAYAKQAVQDGHLVGVMCKDDLFNIKADNSSFFDGIASLQSRIEQTTGTKPNFLRVPYNPGPYPKDVVGKLEEMGFTLTTQNLDPEDYHLTKSPNDKSSVFNSFRAQIDMIVAPARGSFIATQHDIVPATVNQSPEIIEYLKKKDYDIVRLDQCVNKPATSLSKGADSPTSPSKGGSKSELSHKGKASCALAYHPALPLLFLATGFIFA
ncbi:hypothetical protein DSO57_1034019 [Entomophthora muscae]|nr:hypothetical protein DSO57_1034019 [Entomophthora muscae]